MESRSTNQSVFRHLDWTTVAIYLLLVVCGVFSIYAASYNFDNASLLSFDKFSGKQILWIALALVLGLVILLIDVRVYETYAVPIYLAVVALLFITIFIAPNRNGSHSWLVLGPVQFQPAEFGKFATALALAKLFSSYNFRLNADLHNYVKALSLIFIPVLLILAQKETGSALVYLSLFFVLYREGMSGFVLLAATCAVVFFVIAIKYSADTFMGLPLGELLVLCMIMLILICMVAVYCKHPRQAQYILIGFAGSFLMMFIISLFGVKVPGLIYFIAMIVVSCGYCFYLSLRSKAHKFHITIASALISVVFLFSVNFVFNNILQPHQQQRIRVTLGIEEDLLNAGYNVNQSKIAIGSGGFWGKGYLNGTQTKLKYVPEQHTDFIFCTIGEEQGFVGSSAVIIIFAFLILRIIHIAERQPSVFGRVYAYCVASYFLFHLAINVGMVIGLCPVIGIPLPFFSYGGSSLWGFSILLFVLLRIDASRRERPSY